MNKEISRIVIIFFGRVRKYFLSRVGNFIDKSLLFDPPAQLW
jgi:hypothetical protein